MIVGKIGWRIGHYRVHLIWIQKHECQVRLVRHASLFIYFVFLRKKKKNMADWRQSRAFALIDLYILLFYFCNHPPPPITALISSSLVPTAFTFDFLCINSLKAFSEGVGFYFFLFFFWCCIFFLPPPPISFEDRWRSKSWTFSCLLEEHHCMVWPISSYPVFSRFIFFSSVHCSGCEDSILIFV